MGLVTGAEGEEGRPNGQHTGVAAAPSVDQRPKTAETRRGRKAKSPPHRLALFCTLGLRDTGPRFTAGGTSRSETDYNVGREEGERERKGRDGEKERKNGGVGRGGGEKKRRDRKKEISMYTCLYPCVCVFVCLCIRTTFSLVCVWSARVRLIR